MEVRFFKCICEYEWPNPDCEDIPESVTNDPKHVSGIYKIRVCFKSCWNFLVIATWKKLRLHCKTCNLGNLMGAILLHVDRKCLPRLLRNAIDKSHFNQGRSKATASRIDISETKLCRTIVTCSEHDLRNTLILYLKMRMTEERSA